MLKSVCWYGTISISILEVSLQLRGKGHNQDSLSAYNINGKIACAAY